MIRKLLRKLKYLILFLSCFCFISNVHASDVVTISPTFSSYTAYLESSSVSSSVITFSSNSIYWTSSSSFSQGPGKPSSSTDPRSFSWATGTSNYCYSEGKNYGGKLVGVIGLNKASTFVDDLSSISVTAGGSITTCSFTYYNGNTSLAQFTCYVNDLTNFSVNYSYNQDPQRIDGSIPLIMKEMQVTCNFDDLQVSQQVKESTGDIINNQNSNTQSIIDNNNKNQQETNDKLDSIDDTLSSTDTPDVNLDDLETASDTPISDLVTMPLTLLNKILNAINGTCTNYSLPFFYNQTVTLKCFTISDYLGQSVTNLIDLAICLFMCYNISMLAISIFEDITSLRDTYDSLYVPQHGPKEYQPKHGGGN